MRGLSREEIVAAVLLIVAAAVAAGFHWIGTSFSCAWDTSYCANSQEKNGVYEGTLRTLDGEVYRSAEFEVVFTSRKNLPPITFRTDERGRFCIVWASEEIVPFPSTPGGEPLSGRDGENIAGITGWRDLEGRDPPPGCQESGEGVPWYRAEGADATWQYWLLLILPLAAIVLLVLAVMAPRNPRSPRLLKLGALALGLDLIAGVVLWNVL